MRRRYMQLVFKSPLPFLYSALVHRQVVISATAFQFGFGKRVVAVDNSKTFAYRFPFLPAFVPCSADGKQYIIIRQLYARLFSFSAGRHQLWSFN